MDELDLTGEIPWPSPDDDLFEIAGADWRATADVEGFWDRKQRCTRLVTGRAPSFS